MWSLIYPFDHKPIYSEQNLTVFIGRDKVSITDETNIRQIIAMTKTGRIPSSKTGKLPASTMKMVNSVLEAKDKLEVEGLLK